jgi:hypothetical protein
MTGTRELTPGGAQYPKWIPCLACHKSLEAHIDKKCPFDSTNFSPDENTIELILGEIRMADEKRLDAEEAEFGKRPRNIKTHHDSIQQYLEAYEVVRATLIGSFRNE